MSVSFRPIGPWPLVAILALTVMILTVWAYQQKLRGTTGRWRWLALGLRLAAVILCLLAALRPSVVMNEKKKQTAVVVFLLDDTASMGITDEAGGRSRWEVARKSLKEASEAMAGRSKDLELRYYEFDTDIHET